MMETQTCPGARHVLAKVFGEDGIKERVKLQQLRSKVLSERKDYVSWRRNFLVFLDTLLAEYHLSYTSSQGSSVIVSKIYTIYREGFGRHCQDLKALPT